MPDRVQIKVPTEPDGSQPGRRNFNPQVTRIRVNDSKHLGAEVPRDQGVVQQLRGGGGDRW